MKNSETTKITKSQQNRSSSSSLTRTLRENVRKNSSSSPSIAELEGKLDRLRVQPARNNRQKKSQEVSKSLKNAPIATRLKRESTKPTPPKKFVRRISSRERTTHSSPQVTTNSASAKKNIRPQRPQRTSRQTTHSSQKQEKVLLNDFLYFACTKISYFPLYIYYDN